MKSKTPVYVIAVPCVIAVALLSGQSDARAQQGTAQVPSPASGPPPAVPAQTAAQEAASADRKDMMEKLGIKTLRPGPSGNEQAPNHANYDEALANPFPNLPDVLTLKSGKAVTSPAMWFKERRPEIVEDFEREVLGRVPKDAPKVTWTLTRSIDAVVGGHPVVGKQLTGHVDNTMFPSITVDIQMTLVTPADAKGPVPVMIMFGGGRTLPGDPPPAGRGGP